MNPKGKVVPCPECGKEYFATLDHSFWGESKCPNCGSKTIIMAPNLEQKKELLRRMGVSEEELERLQALQDEFNKKRCKTEASKSGLWTSVRKLLKK